MTVIISIADLVESVRQSRAIRNVHMDSILEKRKAFNESIQPDMDLADEYAEQAQESERQLRAASIAHFKVTGEKHPHAAVTIREPKPVTSFEYSPIDALKYALEKGVALKLDEGLFEAYMQALPEPSRPAWFRIRTETPEPTAAIARTIEPPTASLDEPDPRLNADERAVLESFS